MCSCNNTTKYVCPNCMKAWKQKTFNGDQKKYSSWREKMIAEAHEQVARVNAERKAKEENDNVS